MAISRIPAKFIVMKSYKAVKWNSLLLRISIEIYRFNVIVKTNIYYILLWERQNQENLFSFIRISRNFDTNKKTLRRSSSSAVFRLSFANITKYIFLSSVSSARQWGTEGEGGGRISAVIGAAALHRVSHYATWNAGSQLKCIFRLLQFAAAAAVDLPAFRFFYLVTRLFDGCEHCSE